MRKIGENGRAVAIMAHENDVDVLDEYMVKFGYISADIFEKGKQDSLYRPIIVKARKDALHGILQNAKAIRNAPALILWTDKSGENHWVRTDSETESQSILQKLYESGIGAESIHVQPSAPISDVETKSNETIAKKSSGSDSALYVLEEDEPEILGSGSSTREILRTKDFEKALRVFRNGCANRLTRYSRVDGKLKIQLWDEQQGDFV